MTKPTKVLVRNDRISSTDPNDPDAVPAFETSAGIPPRSRATKPVVVNKHALANFNKDVNPEVLKRQIEAANVAALFAKRAIRPDEIAALRRRMLEVVSTGLEDVAKVIAGKKQWNNVQVRLFSLLTERVMPKLSTIAVEDPNRKLEDLSMEELEALALGKKNHMAVDAIVKEGRTLEAAEERKESAATTRKLKGSLITIASVDEAEKAYITKRTTPPKEVVKVASKKSTPPHDKPR